jgi:hypothetical protein
MNEKDKKFIEDWHFYHGKGKWLFIIAHGSFIGAIAHFLFSVIKFLLLQTYDLESIKHYFFTPTYLAEWVISALLMGVFIGFIVWQISDKYYVQLMQKEEEH